ALILIEISGDEIRGFLRTNAKLLCKTEGRLTVDDSEIYSFCTLPLLPRHGLYRQTQHRCGRTAMDVLTGGEGFGKPLVSGKMCEYRELDLRIVCGDKPPSLFRNEGSENLAAEIGSNGNVLQIRIAAGQKAGRSAGLWDGRLQPLSVRMYDVLYYYDVR